MKITLRSPIRMQFAGDDLGVKRMVARSVIAGVVILTVLIIGAII